MDLRRFLVPNYSLYIVAALFALVALACDRVYVPAGESVFDMPVLWDWMTGFAVVTAAYAWSYRHDMTVQALRQKLRTTIAGFVALYFVAALFCTMKSVLHTVHPHIVDEALISIERALHGGILPSVEAARLSAYPLLLRMIDALYVLWFVANVLYVFFVLLGDPHNRLRERYLFCFAAGWLGIGLFAATAMASAGPLFLEHFIPVADMSAGARASADAANAFMHDTAGLHLFQSRFKDMIDGFLASPRTVTLNTASAMPSMHVALAALMVFHARHVHKILSAVMRVYLAVILIGSVVLQWHYAIDGYVAIALMYVLWKASAYLPAPVRD